MTANLCELTCPAGPPGQAGPPGIDGSIGQPGVAGPIGKTGEQGKPGIDGSSGRNGTNGAPGQKGEQGLPGVDGETGPPGLAGKNGPPGQKGEQGIPGEAGSPGDTGKPGNVGPSGVVGPPGPKGSSGTNGKTGSPGSPGDDGTPGKAGPPGRVGPPGRIGYPGHAGPSGRIGVPGPVGPPGRNGQPGQNGQTSICSPWTKQWNNLNFILNNIEYKQKTLRSSKKIIFIKRKEPFNVAFKVCQSICGKIILPISKEENREIKRIILDIVGKAGAWIRISDISEEGVWRDTFDQSRWHGFTHWVPNEPNNNHQKEHNAVIHSAFEIRLNWIGQPTGGTWNDVPGHQPNYIICEQD